MKYKKFKSVLYTFLLSVLFFSAGCEKCESGYESMVDSVWVIIKDPGIQKTILVFGRNTFEEYLANKDMKVERFIKSRNYEVKNNKLIIYGEEVMTIGGNSFYFGGFNYVRSGKKRADFFP